MGPFAAFGSFFVFHSTCIYGSPGLTYINGLFTAATLEFVDAFAFTRGRLRFVFGAKDVLEFLATFVVQVTAGFGESAFELVRDARDETHGGIRAEANVISDGLRLEWKNGEEVRAARLLLLLLLMLLLLLLLLLLVLLLLLFLLFGHGDVGVCNVL